MKTYVIVDLESTCYDRNDTSETKPPGFANEIIEIGAVMCDENGAQLDTFELFLRPKKHPIISNFCTNLTTITQSDIEDNSVCAEDGLCRFFDWSFGRTGCDREDVIFVSWGYYDKRQLRDDLKLNGLDVELINDSNHRSLKHLHGEWNGLKKPVGLGYACKLEGIEFDGVAHRGINDARNIFKIFHKYLYKFK